MGSAPTIAPIFLRVALGVTFLWAGVGKFATQATVQGDDAARLANMGVAIAPATPAGKPAPADVTKPPVNPEAKPETKSGPDARPAPVEPLPAPKDAGKGKSPSPSPPPSPSPAVPPHPAASVPPSLMPVLMVSDSPSAPAAPHAYAAADFPQPVEVTGLYQIALGLDHAAHPARGADGTTPMPIWPRPLAKDHIPVYFAWAAALTEVLGGLFCLVGLLTRFSGFMLAGVMAVAMWLTQFGPTLQTGGGILWIIPRHDLWGVNAGGMPHYGTLLWQLCLMMSGLALACLGAGGLSLDRALFPPKGMAKPAPKADAK